MLNIGDFSRTAVSTKALHFYGRRDFKPAHVDPAPGYRFYTLSQPRLNRLALNRGRSLEQIGPVLDVLSAEEVRGMVKLEAQLKEMTHAQARLGNAARLNLEPEDAMPDCDVIKEMPPQTVYP